MRQDLLADETWRQLDPYAGQPSRRAAWRMVLAAAVAMLVVAAGTVGFRAGLVVPHLAASGNRAYGYDQDTWLLTYEFELVNRGRAVVEVVGAGRDGPGLVLTQRSTAFGSGRQLGPGGRMSVRLVYQVTDCDAVPDGQWPVPVRIARPWGTHRVWIPMEPQDRSDFDLPPTGVAVDEHGYVAVEWQRNLADAVCHYRSGGEPWVDEE